MKTVIEMAKEAGATHYWHLSRLERFAELVRADERNSWPLEMEAMERQVNILTDALAEERNKWMERTAILIRGEREACAKVAEDMNQAVLAILNVTSQPIAIATAIRARSNT